ncbi:DUF6531 domain-containing protein [Polyangium sp. 6x1]|uniref:DUF6531 domain-containing protein n=1 Tax=Polyangium sp. 6x1 TaxID=3042689 RepID=UPI0024827996|nr:DUF6531 domain-containing protein [Polyangium sp. 6x1]MDI1446041.1 DUF6531 domain-containing protein [Polyangium sp. 6x1]
MANNFHTDAGWLLVGIDGHNGIHWPFVPMWFFKLNLLHPLSMGDKQKPTVMFNGVPSVTHGHEPSKLWPHIGIFPSPLDLMTPLHILFGSHKCWLPRGAVQICGEQATCCVIGGAMSLNADCWEYGKWPTSLVEDPGTVQTTPTVMDFLMGAVSLAVDLVIDLAFEVVMNLGGAALKKLGDDLIAPFFKKADEAVEGAAKNADEVLGEGLESAAKQSDEVAGEAAESAAKGADGQASDLCDEVRCEGGHPVDLTSGDVVDRKVDLVLPGAIPFEWKRHYSSKRALARTSLGRGGWAHDFEQWIERTDDGLLSLRSEEGRDVYFRALRVGESAFHRMDRLTLRALEGGAFEVTSHKTRLVRHFAPEAPGGKALLRSIRDAYGNSIVLEYTNGRLRRVIDTAGREVRLKTTHGGRIARLEVWVGDSFEQWVDYTYAKMGELESVTDALGQTERYAYDEDHRMVKTTLKNGVNFHYAYDPETGRCKKTWGDDGLHTLVLTYDLEKRITKVEGNEEPRILHWNESGLVVREETPDGILIRTCEYDADNYLIGKTNGASEATRYRYDARGNKVEEVDPAGNMTRWEYDDDLPVLRVGPDEGTTRFSRDGFGALQRVEYPTGVRYSFAYDGKGRLTCVSGDEGILVEVTHDAQHNVVAEVDARGARTTYEHDVLGRPVRRADALGRFTAVAYDRLGQPLSVQRPDGTITQSAYDPLGNPIRVVDASGQVTRMEYGGTGVLTKLVQPDGRTWRFKYSAQEKLRCIENPRDERYEFVYDAAGRVVEEATFDGRVLKYAFSKAGRLDRIEYPDRSHRAFEYDRLGNVLREGSTDGPITFERDHLGRLLGAVVEQDGERVVTAFERDRFGRVVAEIQDGKRIRYELDARGRRTARVMPEGATTRYRYDTFGALAGVSHDGHELTFDRDMLGRETARRDGAGRYSIRSEYDSMDRIIEQRVEARRPGGGVPQAVVQRLWQYDALGRAKIVEDARWGATAYRYDPVGQILSAQRGDHREVFAYDPAGSIQKMLDGLDTGAAQADEGEAWEIGKGNLLLRADRTKYTYDRRGRRISKEETGQRTRYGWDARDRLREVALPSGERLRFTYDAFGRRVRKELRDEYGDLRHAVDFVWDGDVVASDVDTRYGRRSFVHAPGTFLPLLQAERGEVFSYVVDQVGVPKELIDREGRVAWSATHSAWGRVTETYAAPGRTGRAVESPFRLLGQYADEETGLCCTRFRYFDASTGRWCSPDPLGLLGGSDVFAFCGNPIVDVDPFGLDCRNSPGVATAGNNHPDASNWLRGSHGNAGRIPQSVADKLNGRQFNTFDDFREAFWKEMAADPQASSVFNAANQTRMTQGLAPIAHSSQQYGGHMSYILHHNTPIQHGGAVYDMANLTVVTPQFHQTILDPSYHF